MLHYSRSFGSLPWLYVLVVMLKPLIVTSLYERCIKTFWIHSKLMALAFWDLILSITFSSFHKTIRSELKRERAYFI